MTIQHYPDLKALVFDVQGTATDFRSTLVEEAVRLSRSRALEIDWGTFVDEWRGLYRPALDAVLSGARPWTSVDLIYREALDQLLDKRGLTFFSEEERRELNFGWQKIRPWPDVVDGLVRLKKNYKIATLSNADVSAVVNIAKHGNLPWDAIFAAEMAGTFKPRPADIQHGDEVPRPAAPRSDDGGLPQIRSSRRQTAWYAHRLRGATVGVRPGRKGRYCLRSSL
ncbi:hypothetical protein PQR34_18420 [Paraburkholderia sediminicola]